MELEKLKGTIAADDFLLKAFHRYLAFKETPVYDEHYKYNTLVKLNQYFAKENLTEDNVFLHAQTIHKENPQIGSFVHGRHTQDFVRFAEAQPTEVAKLWNNLYDATQPLSDRIEEFIKSGKAFDSKLLLQPSFFSFLLSAYDLEKYPLYSEEIFQDVKKTLGINQKLSTASEKYQFWLELCQVVQSFLHDHFGPIHMLDIEDFLFCMVRYDKLAVEIAVDYLYEIAVLSAKFKEDPSVLLEYIKGMNLEDLEKQREMYRNTNKIKKIRYLVLDYIIENQIITIAELERIKAEVRKEYEQNILQSYTNFSILYQLFYNPIKDKVNEQLEKIHAAIRNFEELNNMKFVEDKTINGFTSNQNFGSSRCWVAVYEEQYVSHSAAPQYFVEISEKGISYGLYYGNAHPLYQKENDIETITSPGAFTYEKFKEKMISVASKPEQLIDEVAEELYPFHSEDNIPVEEWVRLFKDPDIFKEGDRRYFLAMYELGGEASQTQMAEKLNKDVQTLNFPIVYLAKRVLAATGLNPFTRDHGEPAYWRTFFNGYEKDGLFVWVMKPNLKRAVGMIYEEEQRSDRFDTYTKVDFLDEVFIDEKLYDTITGLLHYKKNIILQGPPGVGKTFIAKRLAFSLMGEKNSDRIQMVQFHQNYAYEDFVQGYLPDANGTFSLQNGVFYEFCEKARAHPDVDYYFIIDEINRGNLSKIFGELFMLIEADKREELVTLSYSKMKFTVPENVYLIGTMNTADRSLAQIEVALRRRFAFITLEPNFNEKWVRFMKEKGISDRMNERIQGFVEGVNAEIRNDLQLGRGFEIGHSFFTNIPQTAGFDEEQWFERILQYEIHPLLEEYFYDRPEKVAQIFEGI